MTNSFFWSQYHKLRIFLSQNFKLSVAFEVVLIINQNFDIVFTVKCRYVNICKVKDILTCIWNAILDLRIFLVYGLGSCFCPSFLEFFTYMSAKGCFRLMLGTHGHWAVKCGSLGCHTLCHTVLPLKCHLRVPMTSTRLKVKLSLPVFTTDLAHALPTLY